MRKLFWILCLTLFCSTFCNAATKPIYILNVTGSIGPATQDYISHNLVAANQQHAALVVINLNTQGGLVKPMQKIIQSIISSPVPIATYVTPADARASGSGTFIAYASSIIAMTPESYIGPANLTSLHSGIKKFLTLSAIEKNAMEDAIKNIRGLAELRHHNAEWAESAIKNDTSLTAEAALKEKVINLIASNTTELLKKLNGVTVESNGIPITLQTENAQIEIIQPSWRYYALSVITNPIVAYLLLLIGILSIYYEFLHPGKILPGLFGALSLILTFYAFQQLSVSFLGLTLLLIGMTCMLAEIIKANFGITALCGIMGFVLGSALLLDMNAPGYHLSWSISMITSLASASLFFLILLFTIKKNRQKIIPGREGMIGKIAEVIEFHADHVMVLVQDEIWSAHSSSRLEPGQKVRITKMSNLILTIEPIVSVEKN